jgi:hypothetical protein
MFRLKIAVSALLLTITFWNTGCGLPAGPNSAPKFASLSGNTVILPDPVSGTINSKNPQIAVDSTGIYIAWEDTSGKTIVFSSSHDGGATFSIPVIIPVAIPGPNPANGSYPRITTDGNGKSFVLWQESGQFLLNYTVSSQFQNSSIAISTPCPGQFTQNAIPNADLTYTTGKLFVTWAQQTPCNTGFYYIYFDSISAVTPAIVPTPQSVFTDSQFLGYPRITGLGGDHDILFEQSSVSDLFLSEYILSSTSQTSHYANIQSANIVPPPSSFSLATSANGNRYVAFSANKTQTGPNVYFNVMKTGSNGFTLNPLNLSTNGTSVGPTLAIDSSQYVYVAFFSKSNAFPTTYDVFLEASTDGGNSFSASFNVSNSSGDSASYAPGIAILGKTAYIVWDDNTNSTNHHIYFQRVALN